ERLQLDVDALFTMHSLADTAIETASCLSRAASRREAINDRCTRDKGEINSLRASSSVDSTLADASRGYRAAASPNQKLFDFAARCSMRNITIGKIRSANRSPNARFENLIDEPCVKTYEGKCVNNAELFLRARCTCLKSDALRSDEWM
ncbi:MAG TPA: hypothetical protein VFK91_03615, partial [Methyloceanibacter sp.]|nr:hypothetical protein [Methyloceanibacter sp.]